MFNDYRDNNSGGNAPAAFGAMSIRDRAYLVTIIRLFLRPTRAINRKHTSYGLKHLAEKLMPDGYVSNGEMKGAMLYCGYKADNTHEMNWDFNISERSELLTAGHQWYRDPISGRMRAAVRAEVNDDDERALMRCKDYAQAEDLLAQEEASRTRITCFYDWSIKTYSGKNNPRGDLAGDMESDREFPRTDDKKAILFHLRQCHACDDAIAAFECAWRQYRRKRKVE